MQHVKELTKKELRITIDINLNFMPHVKELIKKKRSVIIDSKLNFTLHVKELTKKANQKLHPLYRLKHCKDSNKNKVLFSSFV